MVDTVGNTDLTNSLQPSFGLTLGEGSNYGIEGSLELPLDETGTDWVGKLGMVWFF